MKEFNTKESMNNFVKDGDGLVSEYFCGDDQHIAEVGTLLEAWKSFES